MSTSLRPLISSRVLKDLDAFLRARGYPGSDAIRAFGFEASESNAFFDLSEVQHLLEIVALQSKDEALGLRYGDANPLGQVGLIYYAFANAPTLREALQIRALRSDFILNGGALSFTEEGGTGCFKWSCGAVIGPRRQFIDYVAAMFVSQIRIVLDDRKWMPLKVALPHSRPNSIAEFERVLGPRVIFDEQESILYVDSASLARKLPNADPDLYGAIMRSFQTLAIDSGSTSNVVERARLYMIREGCFLAESEQAVAKALNVSVRSLQREMARAGTSFRTVADCARKQTALQLLHDTDLSLTEVAFRLGFSELSAFSRAAKKWFGRPAGEVRAAQQIIGDTGESLQTGVIVKRHPRG